MTRPLALAYLTTEGAAPVEEIEAAATSGFAAVGLRFTPPKQQPLAYPVIGKRQAVRNIVNASAATGVSILDIELITLDEAFDVPAVIPLIDAAAGVGAQFIQVVCEDPEPARSANNLAVLDTVAKQYGLRLSLEFMPFRALRTISDAAALINRSGASNTGILIDVLHFHRSGGTVRDLEVIPREMIAYVQLCDAPAQRPPDDRLLDEARNGRLYPGEGGLPLVKWLRALPTDLTFSLEVPHARHRYTSVGERARRCARAMRAFLNSNSLDTDSIGKEIR